MAHTLELTLSLKMDGLAYPGFPLSRRLLVDEVVPLGFEQDAGVGYSSLTALLTLLGVAVLTTDQSLSVRLNNQSTGSIPLNPGGLLVIFDGALNTIPFLSVLNSGETNANMNGLLGGT